MTSLEAGGGAQGTLPVRILTPHSGLEGIRSATLSLVREFGAARSLAWRFFIRDTAAEHRQSLLGYLWLIAPVLANTLTWVFLNGQNVIRVDTGSVPYPIFVLSGVIMWSAFNGSIMAMLNVVNAARGILAKVNFPHEALIYSAWLKAALDAVLASLLLIPALLLLHSDWRATMLLYPAAVAANLIAGAAVGLILVPIASLYSDLSRVLQLVLRFGFFFTPIIFSLPADGPARRLMLLNPATPLIQTGRAWLTGAAGAMPTGFIAVIASALVLLVVGLVIFKVSMPHLVERLGG